VKSVEIDKENDPNLLMRLGYYIKKARKLKGLTQDDLAERIRSGRQYISEIESGKRDPSYTYMVKLCQELDIELYALYYGEVRETDDNLKRMTIKYQSCSEENQQIVYNVSMTTMVSLEKRDEIRQAEQRFRTSMDEING
jgi:transcriptional regulator with XRE-family HTH domain